MRKRLTQLSTRVNRRTDNDQAVTRQQIRERERDGKKEEEEEEEEEERKRA